MASTNSADTTLERSQSNQPHSIWRTMTRKKIAQRLVVLSVVIVGVVVWFEVLEDRVIPKRWRTVYDGEVYRSGQLSASLIERVLNQNGIERVVDLTGYDPKDVDQTTELEACDRLGIEHLRFPLGGDGTGDIRQYAAAISALHDGVETQKRTLVHCSAGVQRTGGVLAAYKALVRQEPPVEVYHDLTERFLFTKPIDPGLVGFLNNQMQELAEILVESNVIVEVPDPLPVLTAEELVNSVTR